MKYYFLDVLEFVRKKWYLSSFWQHCMFLSPIFDLIQMVHQTLQFFLSSPLMNPAYAVPGSQAQESWRMVVFTNPDGQIRVEEQKNHHQVMKHNAIFFYSIFLDIFPPCTDLTCFADSSSNFMFQIWSQMNWPWISMDARTSGPLVWYLGCLGLELYPQLQFELWFGAAF